MQEPTQITIFDLDHTLIDGNSSFIFGLFLSRKRIFPWWTPFTLLFYRIKVTLGMLTLAGLHHAIHAKFLKGRNTQELSNLARACFESELISKINPKVKERLIRSQEQGHTTILLSSSPQIVVEIVGKSLGFDRSIGTTYLCDEAGCIVDIATLVDGAFKSDFIHTLSTPKDSLTAYTDSIHDLALLQAVGRPIGVNPDRQLRKHCIEEQWEIL